MSDVVVGVRLTADGSGLVGQIRLSRAELDQLRAAEQGASQGARELAGETRKLQGDAERLTKATRAQAEAERQAAEETRQGIAAMTGAASAAREFAAAQTAATTSTNQSQQAMGRWTQGGLVWMAGQSAASKELTTNLGLQRAGWQGVGFTVQDVFASYSSGGRLTTIFAQQSGQLASAIAQIGQATGNSETRLGRFATFIGGGWGIAIAAGVAVLASLVDVLVRSGDESGKAKDKALDLSSAVDRQKASYRDLMAAIDEYNRKQEKATEGSRLAMLQSLANAKANYAEALSKRELLSAELAAQQRRAEQFRLSQGGTVGEDIGVQLTDRAIVENQNKILALRQEVTGRTIELGDAARKALDPLEAIRQKYADIDRYLSRHTRNGMFAGKPVDQVIAELGRRQRAEEEAARDASRRGSSGAAATLADFGSPLSGYRVTGRYGEQRPGHRHAGIDMAAPMGTPVYATQAGSVNFAGTAGAYGNLVRVGHGAGTETRYAHLSRFAVGKGQAVDKGDLLGYVGSTGRSTGAHLHYEVRVNGKPVDPSKGQFPFDAAKVGEAGQKAADDLQQFGERASSSIERINAQFGEQPRLVSAAAAATTDLDQIIKDVNDKLATGGGLTEEQRRSLEALKASAEGLKPVVENGLLKPFNDYLESARERAQVDNLLLQGRESEAEALKVILGLEKQQKPLTEAQRDAVLGVVEAERQRAQAMEKQQAMIGAYLDATRSVRGEIEAIFAGQGKLSNFKNIFRQLNARVLTERLFGDALRGVEDYVKRNTFGPAVDGLARDTGRAGDALENLAKRVDNLPIGAGGAGSSLEGQFDAAFRPGERGVGGSGVYAEDGSTDIVVNGRRDGIAPGDNPQVEEWIDQLRRGPFGLGVTDYADVLFRAITGPLTSQLDQLLGVNFFGKLQGVFAGVMSGLATGGTPGGILGGLKGIVDTFGGDVFGDKLSKSISKGLGKAMEGAQTGTMAAGIMKSLGVKTSTTGAQIGGALGSVVGGPIGSIIGSIGGGLIGGLFKKAKWGTSVVTGQGEDDISTRGNKASYRKNSAGAAGAVQDIVSQIADQLGGTMGGAYNVSIGQYKGKWRVNTNGYSGKLNFKGSSANGLHDFGKEGGEEAAMFAALDAIADGAIKGLSAAVEKALHSSTDLNKAITEALKVQDVELLLGGLTAQIGKAFKDFERQAAERVRIAKQYGFDVVKLEEQNAKDRLKLTEKLLDEQVGSLQRLIDDMTSGSMFEGSAIDRRTALLGEIATTKTRADAGEEGAADNLAGLLEQLNAVSKEAYGTTGGFASDRNVILDQARDTIAKANRRITEAQKASDPALQQTNAALDENNDQNAQIIDELGQIRSIWEAIARGGAAPTNTSAVAGSWLTRAIGLAGTST